jgi:hypothetical protein
MTDPIRSSFISRRVSGDSSAPARRATRASSRPRRQRKQRADRAAGQTLHQEKLEERLALTISIADVAGFVNLRMTPAGNGVRSEFVDGYAVIASDNADDVFLKQVSSAPQDLLVADNSSFLNYQHIDAIDADVPFGQAYRDVYVTNGSPESAVALRPVTTASATTTFKLGFQDLANNFPTPTLTGSISYTQSDGTVSTWQFANYASPADLANGNIGRTLTISSGPGYPSGQAAPVAPGWVRPVAINFAAGQSMPGGSVGAFLGQASITIDWSGPVNPIRPPSLSFFAQDTSDANASGLQNFSGFASPLLSNTSNVVTFALPDRWNLDSLGVIPGSLAGSVTLGVAGRTGLVTLPIQALPDGRVMFTQTVVENGLPLVTGLTDVAVIETDGFGDSGSILVRGLVVGNRLTLTFTETTGVNFASDGRATPGGTRRHEGFVLENNFERPANVATFASLSADYFVYNRAAQPNEVTFAPGLTFTREPTVDLLTPGSTLLINSPIDVLYEDYSRYDSGSTFDTVGSVDFRVTNIDVKAPVFAPWRVDIGHSKVGDTDRLTIPAESSDGIRPRNRFGATPTLSKNLSNLPSRGQTATAYATVNALGEVTGATILTPGSGYDPANPPLVTVSSPTANLGSAVVSTISGRVTRVAVSNVGENYTNGAAVTFSAPTTGFVQAINVNFGGSGYTSAPYVEIVGGGGTGAAATATVAGGRVTGITITNPGRDFATAPQIRLIGGGGTGASALSLLGFDTARGDAILAGNTVVGVNITNPGAGYAAPPTVTITGVGAGRPGSGALATASIEADIGAVRVATSGSNYLGGGDGVVSAVVTTNEVFAQFAQVEIPVVNGELRDDFVAKIVVVDGGAGYSSTNKPTVTLRGGQSGTTNTAVVNPEDIDIVNGVITAIRVSDGGRLYISAPQVIIQAPPAGPGATVARPAAAFAELGAVTYLTRGSGYTQLDGIAVDIRDLPGGANTQTATFSATVSPDGQITGLTRLTPGAGYSVPPVITIAPPPYQSAATATAAISGGRVSALTITNSGFRYKTPPRVVIDPPRGVGTTARATATLDASGRVTGFTLTDQGSGYTAAPRVRIEIPTPVNHTELVNVDAELRGQIYEIYVSDDFGTAREKGLLRIAPNLSFAQRPVVGGPASDLYVEATTADIISEGAIRATRQTYLLNSDEFDRHLAPFTFTTRSPSTNVNGASAVIQGATVAITLGNHTDTPAQGSVAFNVLDLKTDIDSLRVTAATAKPTPNPAGPFPYTITIDEVNDVTIDAVAASSLPINLRAGGSIAFTSAIATAGDFIVNGLDVTTQAPISTTSGRIVLNGSANVTVQNGLTVGAAARTPLNRGRQDIVLNAQGGGMTLSGEIQAPNNVAIVQRNSRFAGARRRTAAPNLTLGAGSTQTVPIAITDNFKFTDLNVEVDITHPSTRLVALTLIAPDGTRVPLVQNVGGFFTDTANFTNTVFDSEAETGIRSAAAPFTGRFRPEQSLAPLYNKSAQGTWRLEVTNNFGFLLSGGGGGTNPTPVTGTLNSFTLAFQADGAGIISGPTKITADSLDIDSQTSIGEPGQLPGDANYFLRTDVNTLFARAGGSIAIDEANTIDVPSMRAGGIVTLRANGVDAAPTDAAPRRPAIKAVLTDVPAIDLSAPNGSIDVRYNSPTQNVVLGNARNLTLSQQARAGKVFSMLAAGSVDIRSSGGSALVEKLVVLDGPAAGSGARAVRAVSENALAATYTAGQPGVFPSTITAFANGVLTLPAVGDLVVGQRILVASGTTGLPGASSNANGVYLVVDAGSGGSPWRLIRDADSDTTAELPSNTFVRVQDGTNAARFFQVSYSDPAAFAGTPITARDVTTSIKTNIGSDDPSDLVQFAVSTPDGTNAAAGSLGKMINLRQSLDTSASPNPQQKADFAFLADLIPAGSTAATIRLAQQLPAITKAFAVDGGVRVTTAGAPAAAGGVILVDGSQITQTAGDAFVLPTTVVNGIEFRGAGANGSTLANLSFGGFASGEAVLVDGVNGMSITGVTTGQSEAGTRLQNGDGIVVKGASSNVTISKATVVASLRAGIAVRDAATGVSIVGSTIGGAQKENFIGVLFDSTGNNSLGSATGARNFVRSNATGVVLRQGTNTVVNTEISGNTFDGIRIEGGTNMVGNAPAAALAPAAAVPAKTTSRTVRSPVARTAAVTKAAAAQPKGTLSATSNAIYGNGRWGVSIASTALTALQRVTGNYLGSGLFGSAPSRNTSGNVAIGDSRATTPDYTPVAKTGLDGQNNQHATTTATVAKQQVAFPWRARR